MASETSIFPERIGKCSLCGIIGQGTKDFLCEDCIAPDGVVIYCASCKKKISLKPKDKDSQIWQWFTNLPDFPRVEMLGLSIWVSHCPTCYLGNNAKSVKVLVYRMRKK